MYDYFSCSGREIDLHHTFRILSSSHAWSYQVFSPISKNGIALIGDPGKFVTCGKKRIAMIAEVRGGIKATVLLAEGEGEVALRGYAPHDVDIEADGARVINKTFTHATDIFSFGLIPSEKLQYQTVDGDKVAEIPLTILVR